MHGACWRNLPIRDGSAHRSASAGLPTASDMRLHFGDVPAAAEANTEIAGWHRIRSPGARLGYLLAGLAGLVFPLLLILGLSIFSLLVQPVESAAVPADAGTPWTAVVLALLLFIPLHELAHALWHPGQGSSPRTVLVLWPTKLRFGVYYEGCMTRGRWLAMRLAPLLLLSVLPAVLLALSNWLPVAYALQVFFEVLLLVNGIGSGGDIVAAIWVLRQVPAGAEICFADGKAYWRAPSQGVA